MCRVQRAAKTRRRHTQIKESRGQSSARPNDITPPELSEFDSSAIVGRLQAPRHRRACKLQPGMYANRVYRATTSRARARAYACLAGAKLCSPFFHLSPRFYSPHLFQSTIYIYVYSNRFISFSLSLPKLWLLRAFPLNRFPASRFLFFFSSPFSFGYSRAVQPTCTSSSAGYLECADDYSKVITIYTGRVLCARERADENKKIKV